MAIKRSTKHFPDQVWQTVRIGRHYERGLDPSRISLLLMRPRSRR